MNQSIRDRFDEQFSNLSLYMRNSIWSFLEQEIIEAERRGEERMLTKMSAHSCKAGILGKCEICKHMESFL